MEYIVIGLAILQILTPPCQTTNKPLQAILDLTSDPLDEQMISRIGKLQEHMQHKIMEQNGSLGYLLQLSQTNEILMKKLIKRCRPLLERLKTPDKVEIFLPNRRSNTNYDTSIKEEEDVNRYKTVGKEEDTAIVSMIKLGRRVPKLGRLFLDVISNEFSHQIEPIAEVISSTDVN